MSEKTINELLEEFLAEFDTPEYRRLQAESEAKYNAKPCKYDVSDECYVHGYYPPRPCRHTCIEVPCTTCGLPGAHDNL